MSVQTRNTVFALTEETTEGTAVAPSASTDFLAFQDGFSLSPEIEELTNTELQSSIGTAAPVLGVENPTGSFSHYFRGSGVEGQAPNFGLLLKAMFGSVTVNATEYDLVAGSTTTVLNVDAGEGSNFYRGQALLVKNASGGFEVRNVLSVATDALTLSQALNNAPAATTNLGKAVTYLPVNTNHPTLSLWTYRGNQGAIELMTGVRPVDMTLNFNAGEFISGDFSLEGIEYKFNPLTTTASNKFLDFSDSTATTYEVSVAEKTWKDPYELATAVETAMNATASGDTFTVSYDDSTSKFTIASDNATFNILWQTGTHGSGGTDTHIGTLLGFDDAANDTAQSNVADTAQSWVASFTPTYDSQDPAVAKNNQVLIGESDEVSCFGAQSVTVNMTMTKANLNNVCSESGRSGSVFTARDITIDVVSYLDAGQTEEFKRYRAGDEIVFTYNAGPKSGGNWQAGKTVNVHSPNARISAFALGDSDGTTTLEMTVKPFVKNGLGEFYINTL